MGTSVFAMPRTRFVPCPADHDLVEGFRAVRSKMDIPETHTEAAMAEAEAVNERGPTLPPGVPDDLEIIDHRGIDLVAIDPPGSRDIDQAFSAVRTKHGYLVHYAIADLGSFVAPGGAIDTEARLRGTTFYSPDSRASLHPDALNHGIASLLPGEDRRALMWSIYLDHDGEIHDATLERSTVRNREAISYREATERLTQPNPPQSLILLREIGRLRQELERRRYAVNLRLASQEIVSDNGSFRLEYDEQLPIEEWNAQISLLTGIAAADLMIKSGTGMLRTLPKPWSKTVAELRRIATGLHVGWDQQVGYAERVRELDPAIPSEAALLSASARGLRGAGYLAFSDGELPDQPEHSAIASTYAHVTAPLRRLCDRFTNEVLLAICGDYAVPEWALEALPEIPSLMGRSKSRDGGLERGLLNYMEAVTMEHRVGEEFDAVVSGERKDRMTITIAEPAVIASMPGTDLELGQQIRVRVHSVDIKEGQVELRIA